MASVPFRCNRIKYPTMGDQKGYPAYNRSLPFLVRIEAPQPADQIPINEKKFVKPDRGTTLCCSVLRETASKEKNEVKAQYPGSNSHPERK